MLGALYLASLGAVVLAAWHGRDYYRLPLTARPHHPLHWELKPGGTLGHLYGAGGAALMLAMLSYSLRRRVGALRALGRLGHWLDFHIWCGVLGPLLIVLHSAFKVSGLIAISFWSMVAVALSGAVGRFLYAQIPRSAAGDELSLEEAQRAERELATRLATRHGLSETEVEALLGASPATGADSLWRHWLVAPLEERRRLAALRDRARRRLPPSAVEPAVALVRQREQLRRRLRSWRRLHELFHYWHVFHKPFAILMYLFAAVHVGVAWMTGYAWGGS